MPERDINCHGWSYDTFMSVPLNENADTGANFY